MHIFHWMSFDDLPWIVIPFIGSSAWAFSGTVSNLSEVKPGRSSISFRKAHDHGLFRTQNADRPVVFPLAKSPLVPGVFSSAYTDRAFRAVLAPGRGNDKAGTAHGTLFHFSVVKDLCFKNRNQREYAILKPTAQDMQRNHLRTAVTVERDTSAVDIVAAFMPDQLADASALAGSKRVQ